MSIPKFRRDLHDASDTPYMAVFGIRMKPAEGEFQEVLLLLYSLATIDSRQPVLHFPEATHELTLYVLDPTKPINFHKNLFEQKELSPLTPAVVGYQFAAASNEVAVALLDPIVHRLLDRTLHYDVPSAWRDVLPQGFDITQVLSETPDTVATAGP